MVRLDQILVMPDVYAQLWAERGEAVKAAETAVGAARAELLELMPSARDAPS